MNSKYALVVIGYNRIPGMLRLLKSLNEADYGTDKVTLIISLDNCGYDAVEKAARAFEWLHGEKRVRAFPKRQGLRKHILSCGDFLNEFEAIAVLEDDLYVAPDFYNFMKQSVAMYKCDENIAGISLYSHKINTNVRMPFMPQPSQYDVFFMQFAQSWGQIWLREQWYAFMEWYISYDSEDLNADNFPDNIAMWPSSSWLKYHIKYCVDMNKFFVYPYNSLTTCFSDAGEHSQETNSFFQVPIHYGVGKNYLMAPSIDEGVCYDVFYERIFGESDSIADICGKEISADLYGSKKKFETRYVISSQKMPYVIVNSFARSMKPHEVNAFAGIKGDEFFLYDTTKKAVNKWAADTDAMRISYYFNFTVEWKLLLKYVFMRVIRKLRKK